MTKVLVHGNPETSDIWASLVRELASRGVDDVVTLSPPGFGAPCPPGWDATPAAYVDWLRDAITSLASPVDLVGHDWGAGHVLGLAAAYPETIRSFAVDCAGLIHPDYEWHDAAQAWQTPELGEAAIDMMLTMTSQERAGGYEGIGLAPDIAATLAGAFDAEMGRCILGLYRAAAQPYLRELGDRLAAADRPPGLFVDATDDPFVASALTADVVDRLGARVHMLDGQSHWWMLTSPASAAVGLVDFWESL